MSPAHLNLTRSYVTQLRYIAPEWGDDPLSPDEIHSKRTAFLQEAMGQLTTGNAAIKNVAIKFDLDYDENLTLEISATEGVSTPNYITAGILNTAINNADKALKSFPQKLDGVTGSTNWEKLFCYGRMDFKVTASTVIFTVNPQILAATRDQKRLTQYADEAVLHHGKRVNGGPPRSGQYRIVQVRESSLQINSSEENVAEVVAEALLAVPRVPRPSRRSIDTWPPATTPYWSISTLALAIFALVIAPFKVTPGFLILTALATALATLIGLITARIFGASVPKTALGMTPSIIVFGFAVYYGAVMIGSQPAVKVAATGTPHLVDTFLLSVGMASTGGFFDLTLGTTAVRVAAFAEMLSMVTVAGSSLYIGAHAAYDKLANLVRPGTPG